jgi:hypothetical protein
MTNDNDDLLLEPACHSSPAKTKSSKRARRRKFRPCKSKFSFAISPFVRIIDENVAHVILLSLKRLLTRNSQEKNPQLFVPFI